MRGSSSLAALPTRALLRLGLFAGVALLASAGYWTFLRGRAAVGRPNARGAPATQHATGLFAIPKLPDEPPIAWGMVKQSYLAEEADALKSARDSERRYLIGEGGRLVGDRVNALDLKEQIEEEHPLGFASMGTREKALYFLVTRLLSGGQHSSNDVTSMVEDALRIAFLAEDEAIRRTITAQQRHVSLHKAADHGTETGRDGLEPGVDGELWAKEDGLVGIRFNPCRFFQLHDTDGDNSLNRHEVNQIMLYEAEQSRARDHFDFQNPSGTVEQDAARAADAVFAQSDINHDGKIGYGELLAYAVAHDLLDGIKGHEQCNHR